MKKVAVLLADGFEEIEALTVVDILRRASVYVDTVSITDEYKVRGSHGINVQTLRDIRQICSCNLCSAKHSWRYGTVKGKTCGMLSVGRR